VRLAEIRYIELLDPKLVFKHLAPVLSKDINFANCRLSEEHMDLIEQHQSDYY
jgi:hypothetical protein